MDKRHTILHLLHKFTVGGAERVVANIINRSSDRFQHVICSFCTPDDDAYDLVGDVPVCSLHKQNGNDPSLPLRIAGLCRSFQVDLIHSIGWGTYLDGYLGGLLAFPRRPRFVFAFHGKTISDLSGIPQRRIWSQRLLAKGCSAIIAPSLEMKTDYAETFHIPEQKISLIYNGVDEQRFACGTHIVNTKETFGFHASDFVVGCVARLDPVKNLATLLNSFSLAGERFPAMKLMIVGDGPEADQLKTLAAGLGVGGKVHFTGMREDIAHCLQAIDVYVLPSFYEGFSMTILEAMAAGLPILAGNVGGNPELVDSGVNGYLFDVNDEQVQSLADLLVRLAFDSELRTSLGKKSRSIVESRYALDGMVKQYEHLFSSLITHKR